MNKTFPHALLSIATFLFMGWSLVTAQGLSLEALRDATYVGVYDEPIRLVNGYYEGEPYSPDDPSRSQVTLLEHLIVRGALREGGEEHAVVLLEESGGGTGNFLYLAVLVEIEGKSVNLATTLIGDRIPVRDLKISGEDNQILLDIVIEGPGDAACCKYTKARQVLQLQDDFLETLSLEEQGRISLADVEGVTWLLREIGLGEAPLADVPITITFENGTVSGFAGCNNFQADYRSQEATEIPDDLVISPVLSTMMMCSALVMTQEDEFLAKLQGLDSFGFWLGDLRFSYQVEDQYGSMLFEREDALVSLQNSTWQWLSYEDPAVGSTSIANPTDFTLTFDADGQLIITTDCLSANLPYSVDGSSLVINTSTLDLSACNSESHSQRLARDLEFVRIYSFSEGMLRLDLMADGGTLLFSGGP